MDGCATAAATAAYPAVAGPLADGHYRTLDGLTVSSIGLGTYLGDETDEQDRAYGAAVVDAVNLGCNVLDTAINYRAQRSERVLGQVLVALERDAGLPRSRIVVCTKGGYIPFDQRVPADPAAYVQDTYVRTGILQPEEIVRGAHAMAPRFLADQIARSLRNLGVPCIDLYYVHNPETQLGNVSRADFRTRIRAAFTELEQQVAAGRIGRFGVATWNGFRRAPDAPDHLSLAQLVEDAEAVAGPGHHFKAIQLPYSLAMPEAFASRTQRLAGERLTPIEAASRLGVAVVASASILQGQLSRRLPQSIADAFPDFTTHAQRALQFVRSTPGVTTALVGMSDRRHVGENLTVAGTPPAPDAVRGLFRDPQT